MYKYIITWIISTTISVDCVKQSDVDEFGFQPNELGTLSVFCSKETSQTYFKSFTSKDSANVFYLRAKKRLDTIGFYGLGSRMIKLEIDSMLVKK